MVLYKKVCEDIIKCVQILPKDSVLYKTYTKAIGKESMNTIKEFEKLPMYNFGVVVQTEMDDTDKMYLEQNIQQSLAQGEIDLEDAIAIRKLRDIDQAERLLIVRRSRRIKRRQQEAQQNIQNQIDAQTSAAQAKMQADSQIEQVKAQSRLQVESQLMQLEMQKIQLEYQLKAQLESIKGENAKAAAQVSANMKKELNNMQEDRKDDRIKKQTADQSKLISQRQGVRGEIQDESEDLDNLFR